jgi:methionyl-tRNA formyltransferase
MRLAFMGTPDFAATALAALLAAGHEIACVYAQPPRPANRGQQPTLSAVHALALTHQLPVRTPVSLKDPAQHEAFAALDLDVAVVAAYGLILPRAILAAPRLGCLNIHASLLPRWRGAAPIQRAIEAGDAQTGVCIMQMEAGLDTGPVLLTRTTPIDAEDTGGTLHDRLATIGAQAIVEALADLPNPSPVPQPAEGVTYAAKIDKAEARLDLTQPAAALERQVRAFNPVPGAFIEVAGERLKLLRATVVAGSGPPGMVLDDQLTLACGHAALRPTLVQRAGKRPMPTEELLRGWSIPPGTVVG